MRRKETSQSVIIRLLFSLVLLGMFFSALPAPKAYALMNEPRNYIVKLHSADPSALNFYGQDAKHQFIFSNEGQFKNIYTFSSRYNITDLKSLLGDRAEYVEVNRPYQTSDAARLAAQYITSNDPGFTSNALNIDKEWAIPFAGFDYAWGKTTGSVNNVVAVIDTGIDGTHEDLQDMRLVEGYNFISSQPLIGRVDSDDNGHGTLVTGILGASANNGKGIVGTNWAISVMPLKALDASGRGDSASVAQAIIWSVDHGANLINMSLGGIGFAHDVVLANAITYAFNKGAVIVSAAGNDSATVGGNLDTEPVYPVCGDNGSNMIIGVAAIDHMGLKPQFSNYGSSCVDVVAPGKRILSTINIDPLTKSKAPNSYAYASGTSLAVPFVVGQAALLKALHPEASNVQIRDQILSTTDKVDDLNLSQCAGSSCRGMLGSGKINLRAAVDKPLAVNTIRDGDLITLSPTSQIYQLVGNQKRPVSTFVLRQRFLDKLPKLVTQSQMNNYSDGPFVTPVDGTLVQTASSPTVYIIARGQKLPITYQIFRHRALNFSHVVQMADAEVNTWPTGNFLPPKEGTLVRAAGDRTMYWVVGETLHPVNSAFYQQRGLKVFPLLTVSRADLAGFPRGEAYIR